MTILGRGVDESDVEGLGVSTTHSRQETLSECDASLARASDAAFDHHPVLVHLSVVREAADRGDALLRQISLGGRALLVSLETDAQHSLVDLGTVMVALLTSAGDGESNASRMPGTDTGDLAETSVSLAGKTGDAPTRNHTGETMTASGGTDIQTLALSEDVAALDLLLEQTASKVNLGGNGGTAVDLDLEKIGDLLAELQLADLGMGDHADNVAILLDVVDVLFNVLWLLSSLLGILGESLPL